MLAVIFLHVQKSKTNFQSHYFLAMSLSRHQCRCLQCTFWFSSLSRHYQYSPRCNLTRSSSPCFSSDDDGDDMMAAAIPDVCVIWANLFPFSHFSFQMTSFPVGFPFSVYTYVVLINFSILHITL
jgi:hypothetical protein